MCVWPRWPEKIKTAWSLFISHAWLTPPRRFTKVIISILTPLLKAAGALTDSRIHQSVLLVCQRLFVHGWLGKKEEKALLFFVSTCLQNLQGWILWDMVEGSRAREKSHFDVVFWKQRLLSWFGYKLHIKDEWTTGLGRGLLWPHNAIINPE